MPMKALSLVFTLFLLVSCGSDDSNAPAQPQIPPISIVENYTYQIIEARRGGFQGQYFEACNSNSPLTFNNFQELCTSIRDEYYNGRCSKNCARAVSRHFNCPEQLAIDPQETSACQNLTDTYQTQIRGF